MIPLTSAKNFSKTFSAISCAVILVTAMCFGSGSALADSNTKSGTQHFTQVDTAKDVEHGHPRFRHRLIPIGYANADPQCRYHRTSDGLIEICPEPHSVVSAGQYVGRDPDARIRGQMLNDFDRGATFPGGR
jgi:hypothetical protein